MDDVEMEFDEHPADNSVSQPNCIFKTPNPLKLNNHCQSNMGESGYLSASTCLSNSTAESLRSTFSSDGSNIKQSIYNTSTCSLFPEACSSSEALGLLDTSFDSGLGRESSCGSFKDSVFVDSNESAPPTPSSQGVEPELTPLPLLNCPLSSSEFSHKLFQSTPLLPECRAPRSTSKNACEFEKSPTKRLRATLRKPSRELFQSSKRRNLSTGVENTSAANEISLVGSQSVDFLYSLGKQATYGPALETILGYLEPPDLCRASIVSKSWKHVIDNVPSALHRKRDFVDRCLQIKENLHQPLKKSEGVLPFRGQLIAIQNLSRSDLPSPSPKSPPVSPSKVRFNLYLKEGRKLETGQTLIQCPKCKLPSRKETERAARCTRRGCQYYFCILCLCKFHTEKICPVSSVRHRKRTTAIGSRESRRNLQRLCK